MKTIILFILILCCAFGAHAQEEYPRIERKALDIGVYDRSKVQKQPYKVYYDEEADAKFDELLMRNERLRDFGSFRADVREEREDGSVVFSREQWAYEYCPELNYVMIAGGHGFVSAYDLQTLEEIFVNPSSYVYSPSGKYRFGTFEYDGIKYYIEIKERDKYVPYLISYGNRGDMEGIYWIDDHMIHYLAEKRRSDGSKYWIGYSMTFAEADPEPALNAGQSDDYEVIEAHEIRLNDSLSVKIRPISPEEYAARKEASMHLRHKPHEAVTDLGQAVKMLGDRLKIVETGDEEWERELEITFNDGNRKRFDWGGDSVEAYFKEYYPESDIVVIYNEAGGEWPVDLNDSLREGEVGNPANHAESPDGKLRTTGYYPGGAVDMNRWFIEKWNGTKKRYELIGDWENENVWEYQYADGWFWTDNSTVLFRTPGIYYYEMKIMPTVMIEDFVGVWKAEYIMNPADLTEDFINSSFELHLEEDNTTENGLKGWHCSVVRGGRKIDCVEYSDEPSIRGYLQKDTVYLYFVSSWEIEGDAKLYFGSPVQNRPTLIWELGKVEGKTMEHYMPQTDTLQRVINIPSISATQADEKTILIDDGGDGLCLMRHAGLYQYV